MADIDVNGGGGGGGFDVVVKVSPDAKLKELLHYLTSLEIKLCADASKEFIKLLKGKDGGELLSNYVNVSSKLSELLDAWKLRRGKAGLRYVLKLISVILSHEEGRSGGDRAGRSSVSRVLDRFARLLVDEKMEDVYKELSSREPNRQKAALQLMASVVGRGSDLASEVAKKFDFKLEAFRRLGDYKRKQSTRKYFVRFAMSFLEVGKPGLLRWILQQRDMYSGVLRGIGSDDDETVADVLLVLRDRVLTEESLVPPSLRSVLLGSVTLEHLVGISGRESGGFVAELAHTVLVMVCTDPSNGLMPDVKRKLKGNPRRILDLMKKLRASEIGYHRDLLVSTVRGKPFFGSAYLDEFPYNVEDHTSPTWFSVVSLAADVTSSVGSEIPFHFLETLSHCPPPFDVVDVQAVITCVCPRPFSRTVMNKGLLHSDFLVKNGSLRLLWEALRLLDSFLVALDQASHASSKNLQSWEALKREIQDEVLTLLPDPQVLMTVLSSLIGNFPNKDSNMKRAANLENFQEHSGRTVKRRKTSAVDQDTDIIVTGMTSYQDIGLPDDNLGIEEASDEDDDGKSLAVAIANIWGPQNFLSHDYCLRDVEIYFFSKLLDAFRLYLRTLHTTLEGSFDFFVSLLGNASELPDEILNILLKLLLEYVKWSPRSGLPLKTPPSMYKHLHLFINLQLYSSLASIRDQAHHLSVAAIVSTGAFDRNPSEVHAWFHFLLGHGSNRCSLHIQLMEVLKDLSQVVVSFLCDAISTVGNNLFRYWDILLQHVDSQHDLKDFSPEFSPLTICILQKCLRVLKSDSSSFLLPEKTMISLYVCNTLKYIMQTQVDVRLMSSMIVSLLSKSDSGCSYIESSGDSLCEWRPLRNLLNFAQCVSNHQHCHLFATNEQVTPSSSSFESILNQAEILLGSQPNEIVGMTKALCSSLICASPDAILKSFCSILTLSHHLHGVPISILLSLSFLEYSLLGSVSRVWPKMFSTAIKLVVSKHEICREDDTTDFSDYLLHASSMNGNDELDEHDAAAAAAAEPFSIFLKQAPFHVLFPAIMGFSGHFLSECSEIETLLLNKLSESTFECLISCLHLVLFWVYQIRSSWGATSPFDLTKHSKICINLLIFIFAQLLPSEQNNICLRKTGILSYGDEFPVLAESIYCHPAFVESLACPLDPYKESSHQNIMESVGALFSLSRQSLHVIDYDILMVLQTATSYFLSSISHQQAKKDSLPKFARALDFMLERLLLKFRSTVDRCVENHNLMPLLQTFYAIHALNRFISPFKIFKLVHWMFDKIAMIDTEFPELCRKSLLSVGCCVASSGFETLAFYLQLPTDERVQYGTMWENEEQHFDMNIVKEVYVRAFQLATCFEVEFADISLLNAILTVHRQKSAQQIVRPMSFAMLRVIISTPLEIVSFCITRMSSTKARMLFLLCELSPLHLSLFGKQFLGIAGPDGKSVIKNCNAAVSEVGFLKLLPTALLFLDSMSLRYGKQFYGNFKSIPSLYHSILSNGFHQWKHFVSSHAFEEECDNLFLSSGQEILSFAKGSLLGKSVDMLRYHFLLNTDPSSRKEQLELCEYLMSDTSGSELLDCDIKNLDTYSNKQALNLINRIVAKVSLCETLLFPDDNGMLFLQNKVTVKVNNSLQEEHDGCNTLRVRLISILVDTWHQIVKNFPLVSDGSAKGTMKEHFAPYNYLEVFLLRSIHELTRKAHDSLVQLKTIPFLGQLLRSSLMYRFEDPTTLKLLWCILNSLRQGQFSSVSYLQLLLAHSQFGSIMHSISNLSHSSEIGAFSKPMSSILRSLAIPTKSQFALDTGNDPETDKQLLTKIEVLKLLRILFQFKCTNGHGLEDEGINFQELHLLLLSSYGGTLSEIDVELYSIMQEMEHVVEVNPLNLHETNCLWGRAALKVGKEKDLEQNFSVLTADVEEVKERWKTQFRENLPIDPKLCAMTVLHFPYERRADFDSPSLIQIDNGKDTCKTRVPFVESTWRYDPVFMLRLSLRVISLGFLEPVEFAGLGLLAIAFSSLSSTDYPIRKLGYETLARFKNELENCQKKKDVIHLRLLLNYVQNAIQEPWQRVPSILATFAAEASLILLDSSHDHYATLSKHLMRTSKMNMKMIPLFQDFLWSSSANFRSERMWMLRLIYVGLNLDDDVHIYIRSCVFENLLSFYTSPLSDDESKELILQTIKKSAKLHKMARHLVEKCGLLSWISSGIIAVGEKQFADESGFCIAQLIVMLEVVNEVTLSRNISEWLLKNALEQLAEISSSCLYKFLLCGPRIISQNALVVDLILKILISAQNISLKRKIYQPHFTIAVDGLFHVYEAVNLSENNTLIPNPHLGLRAILMSSPPSHIISMDPRKLSNFVSWAIPAALKSDSSGGNDNGRVSLEVTSEDSLTSKLLRWLTASVMRGKIFNNKFMNTKILEQSCLESLQSLLETCNASGSYTCGNEELLATAIFHLQQLLGINYKVLPSAISALCLLLFNSSSIAASGLKFPLGIPDSASLLSKIRCPPEANSTWRWSYYQPWKDLSLEQTTSQEIDEFHACQTLFILFSKVLGGKSDSPLLSPEDVENSGLFEWEKSIVGTHTCTN